MTLLRYRCAVLLTVSMLAVHGPAQGEEQPADVLIVEHPGQLTVYNRYQQTAGSEDWANFHSFEPMIIVKERELLSDGFSTAMEVLVRDQVYYLVLERPGALAGAAQAGTVRRFAHVTVRNDTLLTGDAGSTLEIPDGTRRPIAPGTLLQRAFDTEGRSYVRLLREGEIGWISRKGTVFTVYHAPRTTSQRDYSHIEPEVGRRVDETNTVLRQLYASFNRETRSSLAPPFWTLRAQQRSLVCVFHGPADLYVKSINYFAKDLENALFGSGCRVEAEQGRITVHLP